MKIEEQRKDLMAEVERLKSIKYYDEQQKRKKEEQRKGCMVIIDQMKVREKKRLEEKEILEKEGQEIL